MKTTLLLIVLAIAASAAQAALIDGACFGPECEKQYWLPKATPPPEPEYCDCDQELQYHAAHSHQDQDWWTHSADDACEPDCTCRFSFCWWRDRFPGCDGADTFYVSQMFSRDIWMMYKEENSNMFFESGMTVLEILTSEDDSTFYVGTAKQYIAAQLNILKVGADNVPADVQEALDMLTNAFTNYDCEHEFWFDYENFVLYGKVVQEWNRAGCDNGGNPKHGPHEVCPESADPVLLLTKDDGVTTISEGQVYTYTISVTSTLADSENVVITDTWPAEVTFLNFGNTAADSNCQTTATGFECAVGTVAMGSTVSVYATFQRDVCAGELNTSIINRAEATTTSNPASRPSDTDVDTVVYDARVTISSDDCLNIFDTFSITYGNSGTSAAYDVTVSSVPASDCDRSVACLAPGATESYTCSQSVQSTDYTATFTISSSNAGSDATSETSVDFPAQWTATITSDTTSVPEGIATSVTNTLCINNSGVENLFAPDSFVGLFGPTSAGNAQWLQGAADSSDCDAVIAALPSAMAGRRLIAAGSTVCCNVVETLLADSAGEYSSLISVSVLESGCLSRETTVSAEVGITSEMTMCQEPGFVIDDFSTSQELLKTTDLNVVLVDEVAGNMLGGTRRIAINPIGGLNDMSASVQVLEAPVSAFAWENGVSRFSSSAIVYDGGVGDSMQGAGTGLNGFDMTLGGQLAPFLDIHFRESDLAMQYTIVVRNGDAASIAGPLPVNPNDLGIQRTSFSDFVTLDGASGPADFTNVGSLEFMFTSDNSVDALIDSFIIPCAEEETTTETSVGKKQ